MSDQLPRTCRVISKTRCRLLSVISEPDTLLFISVQIPAYANLLPERQQADSVRFLENKTHKKNYVI